jgi:flagellar FliL protein
MKKKLPIILVVLLAAGGGAYKFKFAPKPKPPKVKVEGEVYVLPKEFLVNLDGGRFAKLGVALVFHHGFTAAPPAAGGHGSAAPAPPDGYGILPQEALVRGIVTDVITDEKPEDLQSKTGPTAPTTEILERIEKETDVKVENVLFTDVAVQ